MKKFIFYLKSIILNFSKPFRSLSSLKSAMTRTAEILSPDELAYPVLIEKVQVQVGDTVSTEKLIVVLRESTGACVDLEAGTEGKICWLIQEGTRLGKSETLARVDMNVSLSSGQKSTPSEPPDEGSLLGALVLLLIIGGIGFGLWKIWPFGKDEPASIVVATQEKVSVEDWGQQIHDDRSLSARLGGFLGRTRSLKVNGEGPQGGDPVGRFHAAIGQGGAFDLLETRSFGDTVIQRWELIDNTWERDLRYDLGVSEGVDWLGLSVDGENRLTAYGWMADESSLLAKGEAGSTRVDVPDTGGLEPVSFDAAGEAALIGFGHPAATPAGIGRSGVAALLLRADGSVAWKRLPELEDEFVLSAARLYAESDALWIVVSGTVARGEAREGLIVVYREARGQMDLMHRIPLVPVSDERVRIRDARLLDAESLVIAGDVGHPHPQYGSAQDRGHLQSRGYVGRWDLSGEAPVEIWAEQIYGVHTELISTPGPFSFSARQIIELSNGTGGSDVGVLLRSGRLEDLGFSDVAYGTSMLVLHGERGYIRRADGVPIGDTGRKLDAGGITADGATVLLYGALVGFTQEDPGTLAVFGVLGAD